MTPPDQPNPQAGQPRREPSPVQELKAKDVLTTGEVAKICNVAPRTVSKWFDSGSLKGYRIPGSKDRRIPLAQLVRFMKEHGIPLGSLKTGNTRVLLVNDEPDLNEVLEKILEDEARYEVEVVTSAFAAGVAAERFRPHVLLLDVHLAGVDPKAVVEEVRRGPELQLTKLIALSNQLDEQAGDRLTRQGFDAFLRKPFHVRKLIDAVERSMQVTY